MNEKICLTTGAAGLIASRFLEWGLENKHDWTFVGVDNLSGGYIETIQPLLDKYPNRFIFYKEDCENIDGMDLIFSKHHPSHVAHLASWAAECASPFMRCYSYTNNIVATANIVSKCIKYNIKRLLYTSSASRYGFSATPPFDEELLPNPQDCYANAKVAGEIDIKIANEQHGLDYCILVPHNVIGKNQNLYDPMRNVASIFLYQALRKQPLTVFGDGSQVRSFSDVRDMLLPMWRALTEPQASKQIINIGGIKPSTISDLAHIIQQLTGANINFLPARHEAKYSHTTWKKSVELLGFKHTIDLAQSVVEMYEWAKTQPDRPRKVIEKYELEVGLYPQWKSGELRETRPMNEEITVIKNAIIEYEQTHIHGGSASGKAILSYERLEEWRKNRNKYWQEQQGRMSILFPTTK